MYNFFDHAREIKTDTALSVVENIKHYQMLAIAVGAILSSS